jgi:fatty acid desaturase
MQLHPVSTYARALKNSLPTDVHQAALSRLLWLPVHGLVIGGGLTCLAQGWLPWSLAWLVSLPMGLSFAGLAFVAHEALHGALVHNRHAQHWIGFVGFLPFVLSPRLWTAWHNRVHHGRPNQPEFDPDAYPTLEEYHKRLAIRIATDHFGPGRQGFGTALAVFVGFTIHSTRTLLTAHRSGILETRQYRAALAETLAGVAFWSAIAALVGWLPFLFGFGIPLLIGNAIVMMHILTNHTLSPHTEINDPLVNSLSVTVPRWLEWLTLSFGFHVEHHLFPWMSLRHGRAVRKLLIERWPDRYQSMPLSQALVRLHKTARIYKDATTLIDVKRNKEWSTLMPGTKTLDPKATPASGAR